MASASGTKTTSGDNTDHKINRSMVTKSCTHHADRLEDDDAEAAPASHQLPEDKVKDLADEMGTEPGKIYSKRRRLHHLSADAMDPNPNPIYTAQAKNRAPPLLRPPPKQQKEEKRTLGLAGGKRERKNSRRPFRLLSREREGEGIRTWPCMFEP